jgi:hypothetical protein
MAKTKKNDAAKKKEKLEKKKKKLSSKAAKLRKKVSWQYCRRLKMSLPARCLFPPARRTCTNLTLCINRFLPLLLLMAH